MTAVAGSCVVFLVIGVPTDVIDNPVFGREIDETPWAMSVLAVTAVLSGMLLATYVNVDSFDRQAKSGTVGGVLAYFAVGCPVCNKLVLIALGSTGAVNYFEPVQPYLGALGVVMLGWALRSRLRSAVSCAVSAAGMERAAENSDVS
jgi:hypothetical protein